MIDLINGLQIGAVPSELNKLTKGTGVETSQEADAFQNLLEQMQSKGIADQETVQNLVAQNGSLKDMLSVASNKEEQQETLFSKLFESEKVEAVVSVQANKNQAQAQIQDMNLGNAKVVTPESVQQKESSISNILGIEEEQISTAIQNNVSTGEIKHNISDIIGKTQRPEVKTSNNAEIKILKESNQLNNTDKTGKLTEALDPRLATMPALKVASNQKNTQSSIKQQLHFSEDFVQSHTTGKGNKPRVVGSRKAINSFSREKAVLDDGGMIRRTAVNHVDSKNNIFDNFAKEKLSSETESVQRMQSDIIQPQFNQEGAAKVSTVVGTIENGIDTKVLDLSRVSNPEQLIEEISTYIETSRVEHGKELNLVIKHNDLGKFNVNVQKSHGDMIDMQIHTSTAEAHEFFQKNEVGLLKALNTNGVKVSGFSLAASESGSMNSDRNNSSDQNFSGNEQGFARKFNGSESFRDGGRQKRNDLWNEYRERLGA